VQGTGEKIGLSHGIALTSSDDRFKGKACMSGFKGLKDKA
jgi:hypothetical protein